MKYKNRFFSIVAVGLLSLFCRAQQVQVSTNQLNGTKWEVVSRKIRNIVETPQEVNNLIFKKDILTWSTYYWRIDKVNSNSHKYYITDTLPSYNEFNHKLVGTNCIGKYIVLNNAKIKEIDYYTIISFCEDSLVLYHKAKPNTIPGLDVYITYKRVN